MYHLNHWYPSLANCMYEYVNLNNFLVHLYFIHVHHFFRVPVSQLKFDRTFLITPLVQCYSDENVNGPIIWHMCVKAFEIRVQSKFEYRFWISLVVCYFTCSVTYVVCHITIAKKIEVMLKQPHLKGFFNYVSTHLSLRRL